MKKLLFMLGAGLLAANFASASITIADSVTTSDGAGNLCFLVIDTLDNGIDFSAQINNTGSFTFGADDVIVYAWNIPSAGPVSGKANAQYSFNLDADLTEGDNYAYVWFSDLTLTDYNNGAGAPGENAWFGAYGAGGAVNSDLNFQLPSNGSTTSTAPIGTYSASYQTVPEPATALLALIGGGIAYAVRRRGHKFVC